MGPLCLWNFQSIKIEQSLVIKELHFVFEKSNLNLQ